MPDNTMDLFNRQNSRRRWTVADVNRVMDGARNWSGRLNQEFFGAMGTIVHRSPKAVAVLYYKIKNSKHPFFSPDGIYGRQSITELLRGVKRKTPPTGRDKLPAPVVSRGDAPRLIVVPVKIEGVRAGDTINIKLDLV